MSTSDGMLKSLVPKSVEAALGAIGGWLVGAVGGFFSSGIVGSLNYQEGWFYEYAPYLAIPICTFFGFLALLGLLRRDPALENAQWGVAIIGLFLTAISYLLVRQFVPLSSKYGWIEFTTYWMLISEFVAVSLVGSLLLLVFMHNKLQIK